MLQVHPACIQAQALDGLILPAPSARNGEILTLFVHLAQTSVLPVLTGQAD